jgi:hypothetical protein
MPLAYFTVLHGDAGFPTETLQSLVSIRTGALTRKLFFAVGTKHYLTPSDLPKGLTRAET